MLSVTQHLELRSNGAVSLWSRSEFRPVTALCDPCVTSVTALCPGVAEEAVQRSIAGRPLQLASRGSRMQHGHHLARRQPAAQLPGPSPLPHPAQLRLHLPHLQHRGEHISSPSGFSPPRQSSLALCSRVSVQPVAVLLCPGWEKVQAVHDLLEEIKVAPTLHPTVVLLGVGRDEAKAVKIPKNCE